MSEMNPTSTPACRAFDEWAPKVDKMVGVNPPAEEQPAEPVKFEELDILDRIDSLTLVGAQAVTHTADA